MQCWITQILYISNLIFVIIIFLGYFRLIVGVSFHPCLFDCNQCHTKNVLTHSNTNSLCAKLLSLIISFHLNKALKIFQRIELISCWYVIGPDHFKMRIPRTEVASWQVSFLLRELVATSGYMTTAPLIQKERRKTQGKSLSWLNNRNRTEKDSLAVLSLGQNS